MSGFVKGVPHLGTVRRRVACNSFDKNYKVLVGTPGLEFDTKKRVVYQHVRLVDFEASMREVETFVKQHWWKHFRGNEQLMADFMSLVTDHMRRESGSSPESGVLVDVLNLNGGVVGPLQYQANRILTDLQYCKEFITLDPDSMAYIEQYTTNSFVRNREFVRYILSTPIGLNGLTNPALQPLLVMARSFKDWLKLPAKVQSRVVDKKAFLYGNHVNPRAYQSMVTALARGDRGKNLFQLAPLEDKVNPGVAKKVNSSYIV